MYVVPRPTGMYGMYVYMSAVTLVHPAKAVGQNEMSFGKDTCLVPSNSVLHGVPGSPVERGNFGVGTPSLHQCHLSPNCFGRCYYYNCG